jgi:chitinase
MWLYYMRIAVFFQTWSSRWASTSDTLDLSLVSQPINTVYLAFASPQSTYVAGAKTFAGTGMDFSSDFGVVKGAIDILHSKGIEVMISVGGATYPFDHYNAKAAADLCEDLNCDGLDIDWEPIGGFSENVMLADIIRDYKGAIGPKKLVVTGWSTGAYPPDGSAYQGMNIYGLVNQGALVDWVNIMAYDAGPAYDPKSALLSYRKIFNGPINMGFQVGQQSWGGAILSRDQAWDWTQFTISENPQNGIFVWSYQKPAEFNTSQLIALVANELPTVTIVTTATETSRPTTLPTTLIESSGITSYLHFMFYSILLLLINIR